MELSDVLEFIIECDNEPDLDKIFNATEFRLDELKVWDDSNVVPDEDEDEEDREPELVGV